MRQLWLWLGSATFLTHTKAPAADQLKFGKPPEWVVPQTIPMSNGKSPSAPVATLLSDQQIRFEPGKTTTYSEVSMKLQTPEGLAAGNISLPWNPAADTVTVNKLQIRRDNQIIDVLASGQTFTTMRRETNLDLAMLDGVLTANIQPEGLQQGDVIDLAVTIEHVDPVFSSHVESDFMQWGSSPIQLAHFRLDWPDSLKLRVQTTGYPVSPIEHNGRKIIELTKQDIEPIVPPKGAPARFSITRLGEATDFASWGDLAKLSVPLYRKAESIPSSGPLHSEVEKIRASTTDSKLRATEALRLVQSRVRYVALSMGQGGYLPADADTTWSRRFGDCKGKTALLLGILHSLGIEAEPILVNAISGDSVADRLPQLSLFNHVLVRAHVGGKSYFLDGTRTGDTNLDAIDVPAFDWGLPVLPESKLVTMVPPPLDRPTIDTKAVLDATNGVRAPIAVTIERELDGDGAVAFNTGLGALTDAQRAEFFNAYWKSSYDFVTPGPTKVNFDAARRTLSLSMSGSGKLDWTTGYFHVPDSTVGFTADFHRIPGGQSDAPVAVAHPSYTRNVTMIRFPPRFFGSRPAGTAPTTQETLAGVEYLMRPSHESGPTADVLTIETSERSLMPEVAYKDAIAAEPRLRELADQDVAVPMPTYYRATIADFAEWLAEKPTTADAYVDRGGALMEAHRFDEALSDFDQALALDGKDAWAFADRALNYAWKHDFAAARKDIAAAVAIDPSNPVAARAEAWVGEQSGDYSGATNAYTKSLVRDPTNTFALVHRAFLYTGAWKYDAALADVSSILGRDPANAEALAVRALIYANKGDLNAAQHDLAAAKAIDSSASEVGYAEATIAKLGRDSNSEIAAYKKLLESASDKGPVYSELASTYLRLNRYDEALADSDQALRLGQHDPNLRIVRANIFMIRSDRDAVAAEAEAIVRENPGSAYALVAAAKTYSALGQRPKAMDTFARALAIHPDPIVYINRSQVRPSSDVEGRIADLDEALKLEPDNVDALTEKARQLVLKGDYAPAVQLYDRARTIDPDPENSAISLGKALALYRSGRRQEAGALIEAERKRAKSGRDFDSLCWAEATGDMFAGTGLADCQQALSVDPKSRRDNIALALLRLNRLDEAVVEFNTVIGQSHSAYGYFGRSIAFSRQGKSAEAAADRAEALRLNPDEEGIFQEYGLKP